MGANLYREYQLKFYLNGRHFIIIEDQPGAVHPHTWEFSLNVRIRRDSFVQFNTFEVGVNKFLTQYQNRVLNEVKPFGEILPTLENMTDYFAEQFAAIIENVGGRLVRVESSETPTRSYIVNLQAPSGAEDLSESEQARLVDSVLDYILN